MLWRKTVAAFIHVLVLNAWLANERPDLKPQAEDLNSANGQPVIIDHKGDVR